MVSVVVPAGTGGGVVDTGFIIAAGVTCGYKSNTNSAIPLSINSELFKI
jgi:hypothetical protein